MRFIIKNVCIPNNVINESLALKTAFMISRERSEILTIRFSIRYFYRNLTVFIFIAGHLRDLNNFWACPATGGFG